MNAAEKKRQREGVERCWREIRRLLHAARQNPDGHVPCNHPDFCHAFGIASALANLGLADVPSLAGSRFDKLRWARLEAPSAQ